MTLFSAIMIYAFMWWFVFFMLLPVGVRQPEEKEAGHAAGAPARPHLGRKAVGATLIAALVTWGVILMLEAKLVPLKGVIGQ